MGIEVSCGKICNSKNRLQLNTPIKYVSWQHLQVFKIYFLNQTGNDSADQIVQLMCKSQLFSASNCVYIAFGQVTLSSERGKKITTTLPLSLFLSQLPAQVFYTSCLHFQPIQPFLWGLSVPKTALHLHPKRAHGQHHNACGQPDHRGKAGAESRAQPKMPLPIPSHWGGFPSSPFLICSLFASAGWVLSSSGVTFA